MFGHKASGQEAEPVGKYSAGPALRAGRYLFGMLMFLVSLCLVAVAGWALDSRGHEERVMRGVELGGKDVGGMGATEVRRVVSALAQQELDAKIVIRSGGATISTTSKDLGAHVDEEGTYRAVMSAGRTGAVPRRVASWVRSLGRPVEVAPEVTLDEGSVYRIISERDPKYRPAVEPQLVVQSNTVVARPGKPGHGIDPRAVMEAFPTDSLAARTIVLEVERGAVPPRWPLAHVNGLAREATRLSRQTLRLTSPHGDMEVSPPTLRRWMTAIERNNELILAANLADVRTDVRASLPATSSPAIDAKFDVQGGVVRIIPGRNGTECCADEMSSTVIDALRTGQSRPLELHLRVVEPANTEADLAALGVKEPVGAFTTNYPAGQPRVHNIHLIANLLRGKVIRPGKTFSVNGTVGRRTAAKGFVSAPVIKEGKFDQDVGGGISQFATTFFNAAFFAGLDVPEYQSHSIYIPRYPYGREATLNYPKPDLKIRNNTEHGVLIWPTYTASSITVTLYSTKTVEASQAGQSAAPNGRCTVVTTQRRKVYLADGREEIDTFRASYRPGEGVNCR